MTDTLRKGMSLLTELAGVIPMESDFAKEFERELCKINSYKTDNTKLKHIKSLLIKSQGHLIDEQFDEINSKVWKYLGKA